jgi:Xaa-Pro aminopeptidase
MLTADYRNMHGLREAMRARDLDALVAVSPANVTYTSGLDLYTQTLIPDRLVLTVVEGDGTTTLIIWGGERDKVERDARVDAARYYAEFGEPPAAVLAAALAERGLARGRIGVELGALPASAYLELVRLLPAAQVVSCEDAFAEARMIKTAAEIDLLRRTALAIDRAAAAAAADACAGESERAFAARIVSHLLTLVEEVAGPDGIVASGPNAPVMHHLSGPRSLARGDIVRYGAKASFLGYWCIILRMAVVGAASQQQRDSYARFAEIYHDTLALLRPGTRACDVFHACRAHIERHGMRLVSEKVGHSTGLVFRETPILTPSDTRELREQMVIAYDYLVLDERGAPHHIEDRVLVTAQGPVLLSDAIDTRSLAAIGEH